MNEHRLVKKPPLGPSSKFAVVVSIPEEHLLDLLSNRVRLTGLPKGAVITWAWSEPVLEALSLIVEHDSFPMTKSGVEPTRLFVGIEEVRTDATGRLL